MSRLPPRRHRTVGSLSRHRLSVTRNLPAQSGEALFNRLCPKKKGVRSFAPVMRRRLAKLGMNPEAEPDDLTAEERERFARLDIDPESVTWQRVVDTCDRHLRGVTVGEGKAEKGRVRSTGFDITVASEIMAVRSRPHATPAGPSRGRARRSSP